MDPASPPHDPMLDATLREMADIALPPPVSMMPATWGWAVLAVLVALAIAFALWRWLRYRAQNRYRREALAELSALEAAIGEAAGRQRSLGSLPALVKRTALAVFPREAVAALSGSAWVDFLKAHAGKARIDEEAYRFLAETEYRLPAVSTVDVADARRTFAAARQWIEGHDVHA
ncbi:DUF4381 domain-containing protein [Rhizobiaceae bacterium n13]|uniref:DUF4381 domain-containing protein n=1 Tax=Ferirhizobium litorale TaxID=2927786 RepID=A0AAE3QCE8_9HYPH|nr:DUF4381 domain-containing protein [Fererhizobium litorale]MDI7863111.1 DUF4381 domain-containing protein [Fererhizobium litorale]MDI7923212.1 DUF4381 domain-containing protein [Fererhizobium litorale]